MSLSSTPDPVTRPTDIQSEEAITGEPTSPARQFIRRMKRERPALIGAAFLLLIVLLTVFAGVLAPHVPSATNTSRILERPSIEHLLGTDELGRDVLSRLLFAGRISLLAASQAVLIAVAIGVPVGLVSGYVGGRVDGILMRANDALMSIPGLILAITIIGVLGPSLVNAMIAVGIVFAPRFVRIVRASTLAVREEAYIEAALMIGDSTIRILRRHVLRNILSPLVVQITLAMALAILAEASLSFLGLGVQLPAASWGSMLGRALPYVQVTPVGVLAPGIVITLVVLALNVLGDGIRDAVGREIRTVRE